MLELEGEIANYAIEVWKVKANGRLKKVEPKLNALSDARSRMTPE
jgi:hypothetical protein